MFIFLFFFEMFSRGLWTPPGEGPNGIILDFLGITRVLAIPKLIQRHACYLRGRQSNHRK